MDFNENAESCVELLMNATEKIKNTTQADLISSVSEEKTIEDGFHGFGDLNDGTSECSRDDSFHSVETDEDDMLDNNVGTVDSNSNESPDGDLNKNPKADEGLSVVSQAEFESGHPENSNDSQLSLGSIEPDNRDDTDLKFVENGISTQEPTTDDENASIDIFDDRLQDSDTKHHADENSVRREESEKSLSNDDVDKTKSSNDAQTDDDLRTSVVDEANESFSLVEILEESECSDADPTRVNSLTDEYLAFNENSMAGILADNSENPIPESDEKSCESSSDEPADSVEVENHPIRQDVVKDSLTFGNIESNSEELVEKDSRENDVSNSEDTSENFSPVSVPCPVSSSTDDLAQKCEDSLEMSENGGVSPFAKNSSEAVTNEAETIDSSHQDEHFSSDHLSCSSAVPLEGGDQHSTAEDSTCPENSTEAPNDEVPSSHGDSVPSIELTDNLPPISDIQNEKEESQENDETAESLTNPEESSLQEESASDSTQDSPRNLRSRASTRRRNNSESSEPTLSDASLPGESDPPIMTVETRNRTNNLRSPSKSTSRSPRSRSEWQPKINDVISACGNLSIRLKKFSEDASSDPQIKEEVEDESYRMASAAQKIKLVNFSIKLEKLDVDSDVEIISPPRTTRPAARRSAGTGSRSRRRSTTSRTRIRSRTATSRARRSDRTPSRPTTSSARLASRTAARSAAGGESANRVNGQMASRRGGAPASSRSVARPGGQHDRSLRSAAHSSVGGDGDRVDFLSNFNLRSRETSGDDRVKGILVTPRTSRERSKRVSFRLPDQQEASSPSAGAGKASRADASKSTAKSRAKVEESPKAATSAPSKADSCPRLEVRVPPLRYFGVESAAAAETPARSKRKVAASREPTPAKRSRRSNAPPEPDSDEEVIDENPFGGLEAVADAAKKSVDVWFECQCCSQKYYLIENAKQHVRTHFPNCLTN